MSSDQIDYLNLLLDFGVDEAVREEPRNWTLEMKDEAFNFSQELQNHNSFSKSLKNTQTDLNLDSISSQSSDAFEMTKRLVKKCDSVAEISDEFLTFLKLFNKSDPMSFNLYEGSSNPKIIVLKEVGPSNHIKHSVINEAAKNKLMLSICDSINLAVEDTKSRSTAIISFYQPSLGTIKPEEEKLSQVLKLFAIRCLQIVKPVIIITFGVPNKNILIESDEKILQSRDMPVRIMEFPSLEVLLRAPDRKRTVWQDLLSVQREMDDW